MAFENINKFFENLEADSTAIWQAPCVFQRLNPIPMDPTTVFKSEAEAEAHAKGATGYPGQYIAVLMTLEDGAEVIKPFITTTTGIQAIGGDIATQVTALEAALGVEITRATEVESGLNTRILAIEITYATQQWVKDQKYLTQHQPLEAYALKSELPTKTTLGLDKVDNTADMAKPVSTAQQEAINAVRYDDTSLKNRVSVLENAGHITSSALEPYLKIADTDTKVSALGYVKEDDLPDISNLAEKATTLEGYGITDAYTKSQNDNLLAKKIESGTITHTSDMAGEGVTVNGTQLNIVVDAYTKAETLKQIEDIINKINDNSESAASVGTKLDNYITTNDEQISQIKTKNTEQDATIKALQDAGYITSAALNGYATTTQLNAVTATATEAKTAATNAQTSVTNLENRFDELVAEGGEPNAINNIQVNNITQPITDKTVNIFVPTKTSDLDHDSGFLTEVPKGYATQEYVDTAVKNVSVDLSNYYTKEETDARISDDLLQYYTKSEVNDLISELESGGADLTNYYTKAEIDSKLETATIEDIDALFNKLGQG